MTSAAAGNPPAPSTNSVCPVGPLLRTSAEPSYWNVSVAAPALLYATWVARMRGGAVALRSELNLSSVVAGVATFTAYALVLAALERASAASVAAVRETSVVIATLLAAVVLKEHVTPVRLTGAMLVAGGVAILGAAG